MKHSEPLLHTQVDLLSSWSLIPAEGSGSEGGQLDPPEPALVFVDGGQTVSVDRVEVVLVRDPRGDDLTVHHVALAPGAAFM